MRMLLKVRFPTELGNRMIKDGSFSKLIDSTMRKLKPESAYFIADRGCRCALIFFDMQDASDIPVVAEPLFIGLNAEIELIPAMNADDVRKGLNAAMQEN